jgi:hypothetical protein
MAAMGAAPVNPTSRSCAMNVTTTIKAGDDGDQIIWGT